MTAITKRFRWTKANLQAEVDKLDDDNEIYWDYRDELSNEDMVHILEKGQEGLDEVEQETVDRNDQNLWEQREQVIKDTLAAMEKKAPVTPAIERKFRTMVDESDKLLNTADLKRLGDLTEVRLLVIVVDTESCYQSYRGVESMGQVHELCKMLDILNVNPAQLQKWVTADNENRPSYDPEPVVFPSHPERDGNEYVTLEHVHDIMLETNYGGQLIFMIQMKFGDIIRDVDGYTKGPLKIHKGTWCFPYCFMNGAGPCAEMVLQKDLVLPAGSYTLAVDGAYRYGVQSCYGFTNEPWKAGSITPVEAAEEGG